MTLVRFKGQNHPQQIGRRGPRPEIDDRATDPVLYAQLERRFGFTVDVCALPHNAKHERFYTPDDDGLAQSWAGERVWCNPPYSSIEPWVAKASTQRRAELVVMIVPANRTEQGWWHRHVEPFRDRGDRLSVEFIAGRTRFIAPGASRVGANERPPFGCALLIWRAA